MGCEAMDWRRRRGRVRRPRGWHGRCAGTICNSDEFSQGLGRGPGQAVWPKRPAGSNGWKNCDSGSSVPDRLTDIRSILPKVCGRILVRPSRRDLLAIDMTYTWAGVDRFRVLLLLAVVTSACHPTRGCVESRFDLPQDNRLPVWFSLPPGLKRSDVAVQMDYWNAPGNRTATVTLRRVSGGTIDSVVATMRGSKPLSVPPLVPGPPSRYPGYEVLTARGQSEVVEHRRMEPWFFICDDPVVKQQLGVR